MHASVLKSEALEGTLLHRCLGENECYLTVFDSEDMGLAQGFLNCGGWAIVRAFAVGDSSLESALSGIPVLRIRHTNIPNRMSSVLLHAVRNAEVSPVMHGDRLLGSCLERDGSRELHILNASFPSGGDVIAQTRAAYALVDDIQRRYGFTSNHAVRWWNFLEEIADTYHGFNRARDAYFAGHGIIQFPAATGIESHLPGPQTVSLSLEAIRPKGGLCYIRALRSDLQNEAYEYGPRFSRGMIVDDHCRQLRKIYISGTSHIDRQGNSIISENPRDDVRHTIESIEHLLHKSRAGLDDIAWSIVYCKSESIYRAFCALYGENGWRFPYLCAFVDICRPELNFEMECFATSQIGFLPGGRSS